MNTMSRLTLFNYLILGLLSVRPHSGYSLSKSIRETPMSALTDSPGAVYPALKKLEKLKLIESRVTGGTVRQRKQYAITQQGISTFTGWQSKCPEPIAILRQPAVLILKLAFASQSQVQQTLFELANSAQKQSAELAGFWQTAHAHMPIGSQLATDFSLTFLDTLSTWCKSKHSLEA